MTVHPMAAEEIRKHVRIYTGVLVTLLVLTAVTVWVSYLHLPRHLAIFVALLVAVTKGSLVGLFFMHLSHEKKIIYATLILTAAFFTFLMSVGFY